MKFKTRPIKETKITWLVVIILTAVAILLKSVYREYIYTSRLNDYGLADTSPNFFAALITVIAYSLWHTYDNARFTKWTLLSIAGLAAYEVAQNFERGRTFDWYDFIATAVGAGIGYLICRIVKSEEPSSYPRGK